MKQQDSSSFLGLKVSKRAAWTILGVLAVVVALWLGTAIAWIMDTWMNWGHEFNPSKAGQFGDTFGAVNALFSGLALTGVAYAVALQHKELDAINQQLSESQDDAKKNETARRNTEILMERQATALLAAARLDAARSLWESTSSDQTVLVRLGDRERKISERRIYSQLMKIVSSEISVTISPDNSRSLSNISIYRSYMISITAACRRKINLQSSPTIEILRRNLNDYMLELHILLCQSDVPGTADWDAFADACSRVEPLLEDVAPVFLDSNEFRRVLGRVESTLAAVQLFTEPD